MNNVVVELKECPHCGGPAEIFERFSFEFGALGAHVGCISCGIYNGIPAFNKTELDSAIKRWNSRPGDKHERD